MCLLCLVCRMSHVCACSLLRNDSLDLLEHHLPHNHHPGPQQQALLERRSAPIFSAYQSCLTFPRKKIMILTKKNAASTPAVRTLLSCRVKSVSAPMHIYGQSLLLFTYGPMPAMHLCRLPLQSMQFCLIKEIHGFYGPGWQGAV